MLKSPTNLPRGRLSIVSFFPEFATNYFTLIFFTMHPTKQSTSFQIQGPTSKPKCLNFLSSVIQNLHQALVVRVWQTYWFRLSLIFLFFGWYLYSKWSELIEFAVQMFIIILIQQLIQKRERMKIVLKYQNQIKLYTEQLDFQHILNFIQIQFSLSKESLSMTFQDPEGDDITILNNQDFNIMQSLLEGKEYVRINVEGITTEMKPVTEKLLTVCKPENEDANQRVDQRIQPEQVKETITKEEKQPQNLVLPKAEVIQESRCSGKKQKTCKMKTFMNEMVASLVDERIKAILPCLKQQIMRAPQKVQMPLESKLVHEGIQCRGCLVKPIVGIQYQCPKCPRFNLCETCETKIQHEHNLLKVKKIQPKENIHQQFPQCFGKFFRGCPRKQGEQYANQGCNDWGSDHSITRKLMGLTFIFGNQPQSYRSFVEQNRWLKPRQTFLKYAKKIGMPQKQFHDKFVELRCHKLSKRFEKPAESYKAFVQQNYELNQKDLMRLLFEKGIQKRQEKCNWRSRCFNFNEMRQNCQAKRQQCRKEKVLQFDSRNLKEQEAQISQSMLRQPKPLDCPQVSRAKGSLFMKIRSMFPEVQNKTIYKFVDQNYKNENFDEVFDLWIKTYIQK